MKEFILSLVSPLKIKKYRYMSVFISMLIFVVSIYFISIPNKIYINNNKEEYLSQKIYVNAYMNLPEQLLLNEELVNNKYKINDDYKMVSNNNVDGFQKFIYEDINVKLDNEEKNINLFIIFDINNSVDKQIKLYHDEYKKLYPDSSDERTSAVIYLSISEWIKDPILNNQEWMINKFAEMQAEDEEKLIEQKNKLTNFDLFNISIDETKNNYLLMFFGEYCVSQIPYYETKEDKITYPTLTVAYQPYKLKFDFTNSSNLNDFGNHFADLMFKPLSESDQTNYLLQVVGYVLIFPAIFVLLICWSMKKNGVMKTYKEYYNVASISSILPLLITFVLSLFIPNIAPIYGALFCLFTLFVFIKINSTPELAD